jgi:hypothetical protein
LTAIYKIPSDNFEAYMSLAELKHSWLHAWEAIAPVKPHLDVAVVGTFVASLFSMLPAVMTGLTTITTFAWSCIRLYETQAVQNWLARRRAEKEARDENQ